jgi:protein SCO1/2
MLLRLRAMGDMICRAAQRILTAFALCGFIASAGSADALKIGGPFALSAPDGTMVSDVTYRGDWLLVFFGFTSCPDVCPMTMAVVSDVLDHLGEDAGHFQPILISIDPERDTPAVMGEYVASFDTRIVGLTGTAEQIEAVVDAYGAHRKVHTSHEAHGSNGSHGQHRVDHSTYIYVMDPEGKFVRGLDYEMSSESIADILRDAIERS